MTISEVDDRNIHRLIRDLARRQGLYFGSCLDVGSGRSRYDRWFEQFQYTEDPRRYIAIDEDSAIREELAAEGIDARAPDEPGECCSDVTLALEVIEHIPPDKSDEFFSFLAANTRKAFALTTPNFEYWKGSNFRQLPSYEECRWIPDHAPAWKPGADPHAHKQWMTPAVLEEHLSRAFPADDWEYEVFRAWPWIIRDVPADREFHLYFKLFALAWRTQ